MREKEKEVRLLMLGLDNAGKTTILKKFNGEDINEIAPTLGENTRAAIMTSFNPAVFRF